MRRVLIDRPCELLLVVQLGCFGYSGELCMGLLSVRRDPPGLARLEWAALSRGAKFDPDWLVTAVFSASKGKADWAVAVPVWILATPGFTITVGGLARSWLRSTKGGCASCGYSLEGLTCEVCPECGTALVSNEAACEPLQGRGG